MPSLDRTGVLVAGDMYTVPGADKRGGTGDVRSVWYAFADRFRWVAGVAGNHDLFGTPKQLAALTLERTAHVLDGSVVELDGLSVGGVSYVSGRRRKPGYRPLSEQLKRLMRY